MITSRTLLLLLLFLLQYQTAWLDARIVSQEELLALILESKKDEAQENIITELELQTLRITPNRVKAPFTLFIYIAADNDLHYFAWRNIKQMELIGSNHNINVVIQLNTPGNTPTKRYIIQKGKRLLVEQNYAGGNKKLNSGSPYTLIDFIDWGVQHYPAQDYGIILWNHGSGMIDPIYRRTINTCELFYLNPITNMLEIDRDMSYVNTMNSFEDTFNPQRGICFDDTYKSYISNQDLEFALREISGRILRGQKLGLLGFDACLMAGIEIANIAKNYTNYMVASQEIEYGAGWRYDLLLAPFVSRPLSARELALHIVAAYETAYASLVNDYTLSAFDLSATDPLEENIHKVSRILIEAITYQKNFVIEDIIRKCKSVQYCTSFEEPSYKDLAHFYTNILLHIPYFALQSEQHENDLKARLGAAIQEGLDLISRFVIDNRVGKKLAQARGVSIYFPEHSISPSYLKTNFSISNNWSLLLAKYILR